MGGRVGISVQKDRVTRTSYMRGMAVLLACTVSGFPTAEEAHTTAARLDCRHCTTNYICTDWRCAGCPNCAFSEVEDCQLSVWSLFDELHRRKCVYTDRPEFEWASAFDLSQDCKDTLSIATVHSKLGRIFVDRSCADIDDDPYDAKYETQNDSAYHTYNYDYDYDYSWYSDASYDFDDDDFDDDDDESARLTHLLVEIEKVLDVQPWRHAMLISQLRDIGVICFRELG